jgi:glycosyltransferase involved in cell wall biosynthesis
MKVTLLSFDFGEYCIRLASALVRHADVLLLLPHQQAAPHLPLLERAVNFQPFHKPRMRQPLQRLRMLRTLMRHIRRFDPDVLHFQQGPLWFNLVLPFLRQYPLVLTSHDPRPHVGDREAQMLPQAVADFGFRRAAQVIVHGKTLKRVVVEDLHFPSEHVHVIPHIVLGDDTGQPEVREDNRLILFFGRIWAYKGLEYLIRAEPLITARVPDAKIVIAGEGEDFARYRRQMVHPDTFIVHNEYVPHDKRTALFRQASLVVLPYIDASQSGVIPLAYTFAKPVVATTVGSLPEMVEDGHTGYLVPPRDEKALSDAIVRLLQDQELRRQYGANGKLKIETECSPSVVAEQTFAVYHCTLHGGQASGGKR